MAQTPSIASWAAYTFEAHPFERTKQSSTRTSKEPARQPPADTRPFALARPM